MWEGPWEKQSRGAWILASCQASACRLVPYPFFRVSNSMVVDSYGQKGYPKKEHGRDGSSHVCHGVVHSRGRGGPTGNADAGTASLRPASDWPWSCFGLALLSTQLILQCRTYLSRFPPVLPSKVDPKEHRGSSSMRLHAMHRRSQPPRLFAEAPKYPNSKDHPKMRTEWQSFHDLQEAAA